MFTKRSDFKKWEEVEKYAKELENKQILLFLGSTKCPPCSRLSKLLETFTCKQEFAIIELKFPDFEDMQICKDKYELVSFPTLIKVNSSLNQILKQPGYDGEDKFRKFVEANFK